MKQGQRHQVQPSFAEIQQTPDVFWFGAGKKNNPQSYSEHRNNLQAIYREKYTEHLIFH